MAIVTNTFQVNGPCGSVTVVYYDGSGPKSQECTAGGTYVDFTYDNDYQGHDFVGGGAGGPVCCDSAGTNGCGSGVICAGCNLALVSPAAPTIVWQPGSIPVTVGSGIQYQPAANGNSSSGRLTTVLIDFSSDNSTWIPWAHDGFASTTSHTNYGNNSNGAAGTGNTKQYWRAIAGDDLGQNSGYIYATVNINADPSVEWDASSNSNTTAVIGDTFYLKANGSDPDTDSWGYLTATQIFKGYDGVYEEWAASPRGVGIFPSTEQSITFNIAGTYSFFAQAVDAFGAASLTPVRTVTVTYPSYSVVAQIGTDCASITLDGQTGTSQFTKNLQAGQYNISATGNAGKVFDYWTVVGNGSVAGGETGAILTVNGNISGVYATYKTVNYTVRAQIGFGAATVTLNGVTHNYSFDSSLPAGAYVISSTGNPNTTFVNWTVTGSGYVSNVIGVGYVLTVSGDCTVTATYTDTIYDVIARNSTGGLRVSVNYNDTGTTQHLIAGNYQLSAEPLTDYIFNGWTGNTSAITDPTASGYNTRITVNGSNLDVTATFTDKVYTITGNVGSGGSSVIIDGTSGSKNLKNGRYTLVANAAPGYQFSNWSGNTGGVEDTNSSSTYINVYRSNATVTANFTIIPTVVPPPTPPPTPSVTPAPTPTQTPPTTSPLVTPSVTPSASTGAPPVTPSVTPSLSFIPPTPTPSPTASLGFLAVYTPWTVAKTNEPIWVQSVYPASRGFTAYGINFGDGNGYQDFKSVPNADNFFFYTYTKPASGQTYYSANVKGTAGAGGQPRTLPNRFYIKTLLPSYDVETFYDPIVTTLELPYSREQVYIGSNEWVVKDVINASITKLYENFTYLVNACHTLKFTNDLKLIEWATLGGNWLSASYWHTEIDGLNDDNSFTDYATTSATGFADGVIKNIKSYRFNATTAPDYYNYIVLTGNGNGDHIQLRTNNYENTLALSAASLGPNISNFNSISAIDVLGKDLYILDTDTVYRVAVDATAAIPFTILNQVGGVSGTRLDNFAFNNPFKIKAFNEKVYVADRDNSCVKVYNTALSWLKTIYTDALSAYSIQNIEINRNNESIFILGQTFAPVAPVLTYFQSNNVSDTVTVYTIRFVHDGLRLADTTTTTLSSFALYGKVVGGETYIPLTSAVTLSANRVYPWLGNTQTLTYAAASGVKFDSFKVKALGPNGFNSDLSNSDPLPVNNNYHFNTPYKVFEYNYYSSLLNSFEVPNNYEVIGAEQNIQSVTNIVEMVIDPTGAFIYFVTNEYVYKYLTNGKAVNRLYTPSKSSLGQVEDIKAAFIDDRLNFFIATNTRVFKFVDIPEEIELFDINTVSSYFTPLSSILIQQDEFVQDWVYNKAILRLIKNFDILYKVVNSKFKIDLDSNGNILVTTSDSFETAPLSGTDVQSSFALNQDFFIHSNEFVTSSVVNRTLQRLYTLQEQTLQLVAPRVTKQTPEYVSNAIYALPCISVTPTV